MIVYLGSNKLKEAYIGSQKIKEIRVGDKRVFPEGYTPSANTLLYLPLEDNANDYSNNHYSTAIYNVTTGSSMNLSYGTNGTGGRKKVARFGMQPIVTISGLNGTYSNYTINVRSNPYSTTNWCQIFASVNTSWTNNLYFNRAGTAKELGGYSNFGFQYRINGNSYNKLYQRESISYPNRYNFVVVGSSSGVVGYINGEQVFSSSSSSTINLVQNMCSVGARYSSNGGFEANSQYHGYLSELILENKARTQAEVQVYYNLTKSLYGIS